MVALFGAIESASAQKPFNWRVFKTADGLADSYCNAISISPRGYIWVRHSESSMISWMDGYVVNLIPSPGDNNSRVYQNAQGQVWSLGANGLRQFGEGHWKSFFLAEIQSETETNLLRRVRPISLVPGLPDCLYFLLPDRLMAFQSETNAARVIKRAEHTRLKSFIDLGEAPDGTLWISGQNGLAHFHPGNPAIEGSESWQEFIPPADHQLEKFQRPMIAPDNQVVAVAEISGKSQSTVVCFRNSHWMVHPIQRGRIRQAWLAADQTLWAASINSLFSFNPAGEEIPEREGPLSGQLLDVLVEPKGAFWIATSEGLVRYCPNLWRTPKSLPSPNAPLHAIQMDSLRTNCLWAADASGLWCFDQNSWTNFPYPSELEISFQPMDAMVCLPDGTLVLNSSRHLLRFDPKAAHYQVMQSGSAGKRRLLGQLADRSACVQTFNMDGTSFQLQKFDGSNWETFWHSTSPEIGRVEFYFCQAASQGDLWLCGSSGAALFSQGQLKLFTRADGEVPETALCMIQLGPDKIWVGGSGKIHEFNGQSWMVVRGGLDRIYGLTQTHDNTLWVASSEGLYRFRDGSWLANSIDEGLPANAVYEVVEDAAGQIWAGTARGLSLFHPEVDADPPLAWVSSLGNQREYYSEESITLYLYGRDKWKQTASEKLLFSHRLDSQAWSPFERDNVVTFRESTPGPHQYQIRAMDRNGNILRQATVFDFTVIFPWYLERRLILVVFGGAVVAVVLAGLAVNRHLRLRRSYAEVERIVNERTRQLEQASQALLHVQKMRALGTLAAGIAHDFNNILSIVKGSAQIIESNISDRDKIRTRIQRILTVVDQGGGVIKAMLGFSRTTPLEPLNVNSVVQETVHLMGDRFLHEVDVQCHLEPDVPLAPGVQDLLQQMLLNLIMNAADAMGGHGRIDLRTALSTRLSESLFLNPNPAAQWVCITVEDHGCGIASENLNRIFEPFFTTKAFSSRRGTGLGLYMVHEFAKQQGFGIQIQSTPGQGTTFTIILPAQLPEQTVKG